MKAPLEARGLTAGYRSGGQETEIVRGLSARLRPGEFACLIGINGAGKSTLLRTLSSLQDPLAGDVLVEGVPVRDIGRQKLARTLALVLTERVTARHMSGLDLVRLGRHPYTDWSGRFSEADHRAVDRAIELTGCGGLMNRLVASMSDGERQRVMIARAVAQAPRVMLLDEPTAFLDVAHRVRLTALLKDLTHEGQIAVLMSTHDLELALRTADSIWLVRHSGVLAIAPPEDIALSGVLAEEFSDDRLAFDHEAGGFRVNPPSGRGTVTISGDDGAFRLWTMRALSRIGFEPRVQSNGRASDVIVDGRRWRLRSGATASSIEELIDHVRALSSNSPGERLADRLSG